MVLYRITKEKYKLDISGEGARLFGGRWNSVGVAALYAALDIATCALELLVYIDGETTPPLIVEKITIPDDLEEYINTVFYSEFLQAIKDNGIVIADIDSNVFKELGDGMLTDENNLGLVVPSIAAPYSKNVVLNPNFVHYSQIIIEEVGPYVHDQRIIDKIKASSDTE